MSDEALKTKTSLIEALALDLTERRAAYLKEKITPYQRKNSILSDIGECDRQMVYSVTNWKDKPLHDEYVQGLFEAGKSEEREVMYRLQQMGYDVMLQQLPVEIKGKDGRMVATGKIDGMLRYHGQKIPFEVKSMHPNIFNSVKTIEDFQRKAHLRKYTRQLMMYLFGNDVEAGLFLLTDRSGHWKVIPMYLDYGECELILKRLEFVGRSIDLGTQPDRIDYKEEICGRCGFLNICLPDELRKGAEILTSDELLLKIERREALKSSQSEYRELDDSIKNEVRASKITKGLIGDYVITTRQVHRNGFTVQSSDSVNVSITRFKKP